MSISKPPLEEVRKKGEEVFSESGGVKEARLYLRESESTQYNAVDVRGSKQAEDPDH